MLKEIINWTYAKWSVIVALPVSLFVYDFFKPVGGLVVAVGILVLSDIILGMWKAREAGIELTSKRFFDRKPKLVVLWLVGLILMLVVDRALASEMDLFANHWGAKFWCIYKILYELFSNLENLADLGVKEAAWIKKVIKKKLPEDFQDIDEKKEE